MGSIQECRLEGFICRLCSKIDRNVIHIYTEEGLQKKLEEKINVYLKINLTRYDPLPKVICLPCDVKLEQHHRFIQRVIQNQKKIDGHSPGTRPVIPLLEQHLRVRVSPVVREDGSGSNTYNIEAISSSTESDSSFSDRSEDHNESTLPHRSNDSLDATNNDEGDNATEEFSEIEALDDSNSSSSSSSSSSTSSQSMDEPLAGFSPTLEPVNASWNNNSNSNSEAPVLQHTDDQDAT